MRSPTVSPPITKKVHKHRRPLPDPGRIPRPPNRFILWRAAFCKDQKDKVTGKRIPQSIISKSAGPIWASLPAAQKSFWANEAKKAKLAHMEKYPNYKFSPCTKGKRKKNTPRGGENSAQNVDPSAPSIATDTQQKASGHEFTTTASTTSRSQPSGSRITRVVAQVYADEQNVSPLTRNHIPQTTLTAEGPASTPAIARSTAFRQSSPLPTSPQGRQNPPRLSRPLRTTQPTTEPVYDAYSHSWYPMIPNLPTQETYDYSGTRNVSATQAAPSSNSHASSSSWPPPYEPFDSILGVEPDYAAACDTGQYDFQAGDLVNLPEMPLPPQRQETYQALYYEPPGVPEQWQYIASPAVHQDEWIRPELYQAVPWVPYVNTGGDEEEWAEASGSSAQPYYGADY